MNTAEAIAEQVPFLLEKSKISTDGEQYTYAYQWAEWGDTTARKALLIFHPKLSLIRLAGFPSKQPHSSHFRACPPCCY